MVPIDGDWPFRSKVITDYRFPKRVNTFAETLDHHHRNPNLPIADGHFQIPRSASLPRGVAAAATGQFCVDINMLLHDSDSQAPQKFLRTPLRNKPAPLTNRLRARPLNGNIEPIEI